jgi:pimeloyl-ACP methyl ester carboxylesterase
MKHISSRCIVFITGAFVTHHGWDNWRKYFESKGYKTSAPPWPFKEGEPSELRAKHPLGNPGLASLTLSELIDSYIDAVKSMPEKPVVIGHSLGGMIAQIILNRGLAEAAVAVHPAPPSGIVPYELSFLRGGGKSLGLFTSTRKTYLMSFPDFQYAFVNGMKIGEQKAAYDLNAIPESKTVTRGGLTKQAAIDWKRSHGPLLITSGSEDTIIPASMNLRNFKKYSQNNGSITEYKEFPGRNHYVLGQSTWKEDADFILDWIAKT